MRMIPLTLLAAVLATGAQAATFSLDSFNISQFVTSGTGTSASQVADATAPGGFRDVQVLNVDGRADGTTFLAGPSGVALSNGPQVSGTGLLTYDGDDDPTTVNTSGLGGFDLTFRSRGDSLSFLGLESDFDFEVTTRVWDMAGGFSRPVFPVGFQDSSDYRCAFQQFRRDRGLYECRGDPVRFRWKRRAEPRHEPGRHRGDRTSAHPAAGVGPPARRCLTRHGWDESPSAAQGGLIDAVRLAAYPDLRLPVHRQSGWARNPMAWSRLAGWPCFKPPNFRASHERLVLAARRSDSADLTVSKRASPKPASARPRRGGASSRTGNLHSGHVGGPLRAPYCRMLRTAPMSAKNTLEI